MGYISNCCFCSGQIRHDQGEPYLNFKNKSICSTCYIDIIPEIYSISGHGDGGLIWYAFKMCLNSRAGKKKRRSLDKKIFKELLRKYNFKCVFCQSKDKLSIDHIHPVSKGGNDDLSNLQILCKSCNSQKGSKIGFHGYGLYSKLIKEYNSKCLWCNSSDYLVIDYIVSLCNGGADDISNMRILCNDCKERKEAVSNGKTN